MGVSNVLVSSSNECLSLMCSCKHPVPLLEDTPTLVFCCRLCCLYNASIHVLYIYGKSCIYLVRSVYHSSSCIVLECNAGHSQVKVKVNLLLLLYSFVYVSEGPLHPRYFRSSLQQDYNGTPWDLCHPTTYIAYLTNRYPRRSFRVYLC